MKYKVYTVYKLLFDNKHFYIGCTCNTKKRHYDHMLSLKHNVHRNKHMQKLFNDNNDISIDMEIIKQFDNKKEAYAYETKTINEIGDDPLCLNIQSTSEQKEYLSKPLSKATRLKLSEANKGKKHPNWGKSRSEETKRKMSESTKGIPKPKVACPHCNKIGGLAIMHRYHFDNCKSIIQS